MSSSVLNFNVGVLGHVDSGKTTLAKALSSIASTAAFDKNPQSQERGITIDLGFSSFCVKCPDHISSAHSQYETLQFTLVDCPGHASLIRTIIGGSQIIDLMILVVDVTKGIQAQTAECLVIGEITCEHMVVVVNKIDLLPSDKRQLLLEKMTKKIKKTFEKTKFSNVEIVSVAAKPGGGLTDNPVEPIGIKSLVDALCCHAYLPKRTSKGPFIFSVDHCFLVKGQGTVMTGTVIQGSVAISDVVEIPSAKITRKVKSIQIFKVPVDKAMQGDRVGLCVTQFNPKLLERGTVCTPGCMETVDAVIAIVRKIPYYKGTCCNKSKFHVSIVHDTVMAKCSFFGSFKGEKNSENWKSDVSFDFNEEYVYLNELQMTEQTDNNSSDIQPVNQYALLEFEKPVILNNNCLLIGSKLDTNIHLNVCRLAFYGKVLVHYANKQFLNTSLSMLKVYKVKNKEGVVERMNNEYEVIGRSLIKKETNIQLFIGLKVQLSTGEEGVIESGFGQSGKVKIRIPKGLQPDTIAALNTNRKKGSLATAENSQAVKITLNFKKYIYDSKKKIVQA